MTPPELQSELIEFILSDLARDKGIESLEPDDELLESSLVDSLGIMRLIAFIEQQFGYAVPSEDLVIENFLSVTAIVDYLSPKLSDEGERNE